jgi:hypothetical protein
MLPMRVAETSGGGHSVTTTSQTTGISVSNANTGSGGAHSVTQLTLVVNYSSKPDAFSEGQA